MLNGIFIPNGKIVIDRCSRYSFKKRKHNKEDNHTIFNIENNNWTIRSIYLNLNICVSILLIMLLPSKTQ